MRIRFLFLPAMLMICSPATVRPSGPPAAAVRQLRIDPSTTKVVVGHARLSVEPLLREDGGLGGSYKLEVSPIPIGNESGRLSVKLSDAELQRLIGGDTVEFTGQAVSTSGNHSAVRGTATPAGSSGSGALRVHIASSKGKLVFQTSYHLEQ